VHDGRGVLYTEDLRKTYRPDTRALDGISLEVEKGRVFGLLGANGAGKTTFLRIVATQLLPSSGTVRVLGFDAVKEPQLVRRRIAVVPQEGRPLLLQTPFEHVVTYLVSRGLTYGDARRQADTTLGALNLAPYRDTLCANLSGGLRQRVLIAMAMSSDAELLLLDEPTIGLDPIARIDVWNLIRKYVADGRTILLTTHYMDEAEQLSDSVAIINKGRLVTMGAPSEIKKGLSATHTVIVRTTESATGFERFGKVLRAGTGVRVLTTQEGASDLASFCTEKGYEVTVRQSSLEDVYISEVGHIEDD